MRKYTLRTRPEPPRAHEAVEGGTGHARDLGDGGLRHHINPRAIGTNLKKLVEEFHKKLPQLHITLGWIDTTTDNNATKVQVFDGQHKAAAQILLGARRLAVRVFIDPNTDTLLTANAHAGTTLRQVAFDKSVQRNLGSSLLADRMQRYRRESLQKPMMTKISPSSTSLITSRARVGR